MPSFVDRKDRRWELHISWRTRLKAKRDLGIDLADVSRAETWFGRLYSELETLVGLLWVVCEEQIDERGLDEMEFGDGLDGAVLDRAMEALVEAVADFFRNPKMRELIRKAAAKATATENAMIDRASRDIDALDPARLAETSNESSTKRPGSSASTPGRTA